MDRLVTYHCRGLASKLRISGQSYRAGEYVTTLGANHIIGDARGVLIDQLVPQGYFCLRAGRVPEREFLRLDAELARQAQVLAGARDPAVIADALSKLSDIFGRVGANAAN